MQWYHCALHSNSVNALVCVEGDVDVTCLLFLQAGQTDYMLSNLRWAADWLSAARYQPDGFVAVTWLPGDSISASHK
jgi:hypothetical protein